jgi:hypothetical protein
MRDRARKAYPFDKLRAGSQGLKRLRKKAISRRAAALSG